MKEDFEKELGKLMDKYSILKNDDIKNTLVNNLHKYTNYKEGTARDVPCSNFGTKVLRVSTIFGQSFFGLISLVDAGFHVCFQFRYIRVDF